MKTKSIIVLHKQQKYITALIYIAANSKKRWDQNVGSGHRWRSEIARNNHCSESSLGIGKLGFQTLKSLRHKTESRTDRRGLLTSSLLPPPLRRTILSVVFVGLQTTVSAEISMKVRQRLSYTNIQTASN